MLRNKKKKVRAKKLINKLVIILKINFPKYMEYEFAIICSRNAVPLSSSLIKVRDKPIIEVKKSTIHKSPALVSIDILSEL